MGALGKFLAFCLMAVGVIALLPLLTAGFAIFAGLGVFLIWLLPIWIIACSDKTTGGEKVCWILAIFCLSWFAWVFYFFIAPIKPKRNPRYDRDRHYQYY